MPRLEQFLEVMVQQARHGSALAVRALLATLYWEARHRGRAIAVLEPALAAVWSYAQLLNGPWYAATRVVDVPGEKVRLDTVNSDFLLVITALPHPLERK